MLMASGKKIQLKLCKNITQAVTAICFNDVYSSTNGFNNPRNSEQLETCSPEFLLGMGNGELHACQFVKKELEDKFVGFFKPSGVQNYEGIDQKAIRAVHIFNINANTVNAHQCTDKTTFVYNNFPEPVKQYL